MGVKAKEDFQSLPEWQLSFELGHFYEKQRFQSQSWTFNNPLYECALVQNYLLEQTGMDGRKNTRRIFNLCHTRCLDKCPMTKMD